jgi:y4mF family transcriptional regulator
LSTIGQYLKQKRKQFGLTQEDLSGKSGVGLRLIREIEQGKTTMRMDKVQQILDLFGATLTIQETRKIGQIPSERLERAGTEP